MAKYPRLIQIKQKFTSFALNNTTETVKSEISNLKLDQRVKPGSSIAITAGSRGIAEINKITKAVVDELIRLGGIPFIIPAMGSHGGATAKGQLDVLAGYGITEENMGVPIKSSMEVVKIGDSKEGIPVYVDKNAIAANHVVMINRVKPHTRFVGEIESGLIKMLLVGLGKDVGAKTYHRAIMKFSFDQIIASVLPMILSKLSVLFGLAIIENAYGNVANINAVTSENIIKIETKLKKEAFTLMPKLPFSNIDLLIIDEMGKDISGTGMDTNIVGRKQESTQMKIFGQIFDEDVRIARIFVRDLTTNSRGNACGIGLADFTSRKLINKINFQETYINCITAIRPEGAKIPMAFDCDKDAIDAAIFTCGTDDTKNAKIVWIKNTLDLEKVIISEAYLDDLKRRDDLERLSSIKELVFDSSGNLPLFNIWK
ncbi:MAG: lactate racemase domain-containing protein [Candidatus Scalinduaceae bacterium]